MDILTPHEGLTNEKIAKAQIEALEQKKNEYHLVASMTKVRGHSLFKFNTVTRIASKVNCEGKQRLIINPYSGQLEFNILYNMNVDKDCYYEQALNMPNFIKRLRKRGLIKTDEIIEVK